MSDMSNSGGLAPFTKADLEGGKARLEEINGILDDAQDLLDIGAITQDQVDELKRLKNQMMKTLSVMEKRLKKDE